MSGNFISTGLITNNGKKELKEIERLMNLKINDISIQVIPLSTSNIVNWTRVIGIGLNYFIHPAFTPHLSHIAIQLNMENGEDIIIMEYGQYYSVDSDEIKNTNIFSSCSNGYNSSNESRGNFNENLYWYINKDGARITKIDNRNFQGENPKQEKKEYQSFIVSNIIAANHYGVPYKKFEAENIHLFFHVDCDIKNKITLRELCNYFKGESWQSKNYNVITHNCQKFAAEIIKILKAVRIKEEDKLRCMEKLMLPNCIISALWHNEELSFTNTMGRIPIFGFFYDTYKAFKDY